MPSVSENSRLVSVSSMNLASKAESLNCAVNVPVKLLFARVMQGVVASPITKEASAPLSSEMSSPVTVAIAAPPSLIVPLKKHLQQSGST